MSGFFNLEVGADCILGLPPVHQSQNSSMWANRIRQFLWKRRGVLVTAPGVAGLLVLLQFTGSIQFLEWIVLDRFFQLRSSEQADSRIVLITISEEDIKHYGWPLSDELLAKLLIKLRQQQPRVIGMDLYRDRPVGNGHADLVKVFASTPNLIGITKAIPNPQGSAVDPPPTLKKLGQIGASDLVIDSDGKIRRGLLSLRDPQGQIVLALGAQLALMYMKADGITPKVVDAQKNNIQIGKARFSRLKPNDGGYIQVNNGGYQILANFRNPQNAFLRVSMQDVLTEKIPPNLLHQRAVIVGTVAESLGDFFYTSYSQDLVSRSAGMEVHAALTSQIISAALDGRRLFRFWPDPWEWCWLLGWTVIGARLGWSLSSPRRTAIASLVAGFFLISSTYGLFLAGWWVPLVLPLFGLIGATVVNKGYILWDNLKKSYASLEEYSKKLEQKVEERTQELSQKNVLLEQEIHERKQAEAALFVEKEKSERLLLNILPKAISDELKQGRGNIATRFDSVTVLFSDIVDFTSLASRLSPSELVSVLNEIFSRFDHLVERYGLEKIKTIGDAYMVVGGLPELYPNHAEAIADMAIEMQQEVMKFYTDQGEPFRLRIGINTGPVVAGVLGIKKFSYDLWGDTVNVASRMEAHGIAGKIQVTETTYQLLKDKYKFTERGEIEVKGKGTMTTYFLIGRD